MEQCQPPRWIKEKGIMSKHISWNLEKSKIQHKERLKVTTLAWWPSGGNVTHNHLMEMRRLDCDETLFLSSMQLRVITLVWWPDDGNVIPLDIHGRYRLARDETSYPSTNLLSILYYIVGPLYSKISVSFLSWVIPKRNIWKVHTYDFIFYPTSIPLGLHPLLPIDWGTTPSWANTPLNPKRQGNEGF